MTDHPGIEGGAPPDRRGARGERDGACPISYLLDVISILHAHGEAEKAAPLEEAVRQHMDTGASLDSGLGLAGGHGIRKARTRFLKMQRAAALREAWELCDATTPWLKSVALADQVRRYETDIWPRHRTLERLPDGSSRLRTALFRAFKSGAVPRTARGLDKLLNRMGRIQFTGAVENERHEEPDS